ncbi:MAG: glycosyltransferase [Candidatus Omnitrophica bacterium]|nr:glycosyltransferase [Candidatus Omnitrophota bacterium]
MRVHTYHGHVFDGYFSPWKTRFFMGLERFLARRTDCLVVMGREIAGELVEKYRIASAEKVRVFYPGLDLTEYLNCASRQGTLRTELKLTRQDIVVAFIGRLSAVKRPQLFVKIAEAAVRQNPSFRFLIVGGGEEEDSIVTLIREKGLQDKMILLGWRDDLPVIYSDVDIVAQCSSDEGTPNVLIEALACSKPVVATNVGAIPEIVQHGKSGFLVERDDENGFIKALLTLGQDPVLRRQMGCFGREFVKNRFSVAQLVDQTERLYQELLVAKKKNCRSF